MVWCWHIHRPSVYLKNKLTKLYKVWKIMEVWLTLMVLIWMLIFCKLVQENLEMFAILIFINHFVFHMEEVVLAMVQFYVKNIWFLFFPNIVLMKWIQFLLRLIKMDHYGLTEKCFQILYIVVQVSYLFLICTWDQRELTKWKCMLLKQIWMQIISENR